MVYREGERKFCMGEGTEDRRQAYIKHVVLEPEHENEYAQPLLTLFDELLAWDLASGTAALYFTQRAGPAVGKPDRAGISGICLEPCNIPGVQPVPTFFSTVHERTYADSKL